MGHCWLALEAGWDLKDGIVFLVMVNSGAICDVWQGPASRFSE